VVGTSLLDPATEQVILAEPSAGPYPPLADDVSVGELVASRFGTEVVDRLVDPLLGGVYAGHAGDISLQMAIPGLALRLAAGGSLLEAAAELLAPSLDAAGPVFGSLRGGLARLAEVLAADSRISVRTATPVRECAARGSGFRLRVGSAAGSETVDVDAVVLAVPAGKAAVLLDALAPAAAAALAQVATASVVIVTLAFPQLAAGVLPAGSGILIPEVEGLEVKAMTFSSQKWPGVGGESSVSLLRGSFGRAGEEVTLQRSDADLIESLRGVLATVTGLTTRPVDTQVQRWGGGLPQYRPGHLDLVRQVRAAVAEVAGLAVCGASYDGVGVPACIGSGTAAADRVLGWLSERGQ
jgi:protoporphyrinogen/coproporphyrinogen III oxidase